MVREKSESGMTAAADARCNWNEHEGQLELNLSGDIDHHTAAQLRAQLDALILQKRPHVLRLNLSAISFMDSSGLGLVMGRYALMTRVGGTLIIVRPSAPAKRMLQLAAMERFLQIEDDETASKDIVSSGL